MKNTTNKMDLRVFESILKRANSYNVNKISLYNWGEPFLCNDLVKYLEIADIYSIKTGISTNLSLPKLSNLKDVLYTGKGYLHVSLSGFNQETQEIYHRGSNIDTIKKHLTFISDCYLKKPFDRTVSIKFLDFGYNTNEYKMYKDWIKDKPGINIFKSNAYGTPQKVESRCYQDDSQYRSEKEITARFLYSFPKRWGHNEVIYSPINRVCKTFTTININHEGDVYVCCSKPNFPLFKIGNFINDDLDELYMRKLFHPICQICPGAKKQYELPLSLKTKIIKLLD